MSGALEAAFWGFVGGIALVLGAIYALVGAPSARVVGLIMAFGSGVLISAVAYELVAEAFVESGGSGVVALGLAVGAFTYSAATSSSPAATRRQTVAGCRLLSARCSTASRSPSSSVSAWSAAAA